MPDDLSVVTDKYLLLQQGKRIVDILSLLPEINFSMPVCFGLTFMCLIAFVWALVLVEYAMQTIHSK